MSLRSLSSVLLCMTALTVNACREQPASGRADSAHETQVSASRGANETRSSTAPAAAEASATAANTTGDGTASGPGRGEGVTRTIAPAVLRQQLADAKKLAAAMEAYARDHGGKYPSAADMAGLEAALVPDYLQSAPQTPFDVSSTPDGYTINTITGTRLLAGHR